MRYPTMIFKGDYQSGVTYNKYDVVQYNNLHYCALSDTNQNPTTDDWSELEQIDRVAMVARGSYSNSTQYQKLDVVKANGTTYVALQSGTGNLPSSSPTYWQQLAATSSYRPTLSSGILV